MTRKENVEALMAQIGPVLDPLGIVAFPSEATWGVQIDEDLSVLVDLDEAQGKIVLSCTIGLPPSGERIKLYELMLHHNYLWHLTGGSRMAVDGPDGNVTLIFDVPVGELDVVRLTSIIRNFSEAARAWREIIKRPIGGRSAAGPEPLDMHIMHMIRV